MCNRYKKIFFLCFFFLIFILIFCEEEKQNKVFPKVKLNTEISLQADYPWNVSLMVSEFIKFNSNITDKKYTELSFSGILGLSTVEAKLGIKFIYLNFLDFFTELSIGSGWCFKKLFIYGLAGNNNFRGLRKIEPYNLSKTVFFINSGIDLHYNLADILKTSWTQLIFRTIQKIKYKTLIPSKETDFWFWENDLGENRTGALYSASYSIEYYMPLYLNKMALKLTTEKKLYQPIERTINKAEKLWNFELSFSMFFKPTDFITIKLEPIWSSSTLYMPNSERVYFTRKKLYEEKQQSIIFKKVSVSISFNF